MSDHDDQSAAVLGRSSTVQVILASVITVLLGVLLVTPAPGGFGRAAAVVGLVLAEASVLYVGYGVLTRIASPAAKEIFVSN